MRWLLTNCLKVSGVAIALLLSACSEKAPEASSEAPGISPASAPGVAFTYNYDFLVPNSAVAAVQEQHAAACEKLGPARCRIKGLSFRVGRGSDTYASLDLLLDRDLARGFGKDMVSGVEKAGGQLSSEEITGEDLAPRLAQAARAASEADARLKEIDARLKQSGLGDKERTALEEEASGLRKDRSGANADQSDAQTQLASTPMHLRYQGINSLAISNNPLAGAVEAMMSSGQAMVWTVLIAIGTALPWLALLVACLLLWRLAPVQRLLGLIFGKHRNQAAPPPQVETD